MIFCLTSRHRGLAVLVRSYRDRVCSATATLDNIEALS